MAVVMGSAVIGVVTPPAGGVTFLNVPIDLKAKIKSITIDNQSGAQRQINLRDIVTADPYTSFAGVGVPAPIATYYNRGQYSVPSGITMVIDKNALQALDILDLLNICADATNAACVITIEYDLL
jgi:hypothetical protein